ncbi:MAG TPA: hypothetical protein VKA09_12910 [Nitrososphaeraceae archaeon]|nr:hypothetical protein [Nitrososphaeraceae archaeon]
MTEKTDQESDDNLTYDQLLEQAKGSANYYVPRLCRKLRKENPNYPSYDVREIVMKDCIPIWQKDTIRRALPDEYKDKMRQELGREGNKAKYGSEQATEFADSGDNQRDSNPAKSSSFGPVEDVSEDFDKMNRGQGVITESEKIKKLEERLNQLEEEKEMTKKENQILKEKTQPELLKELQEKFYDEPGILDANKLHKVSEQVGKELVILIGNYNSILKDAVESGQPVPMGTYIMTKPEKKLIPVRILIDFDRRTIKMELWQKKLQKLPRI